MNDDNNNVVRPPLGAEEEVQQQLNELLQQQVELPVQQQVELPAIESLEDYLQRYGLPSNNDINNDDDDQGEFNGLNRHEAMERIEAEKAYLDAFIAKHHHNNDHGRDDSVLSSPYRKTGYTPRETIDDDDGMMISIILSNNKRHVMSIKPLSQYCETVKRMMMHRSRFGVVNDNTLDDDDSNLLSSRRVHHEDDGKDNDCSSPTTTTLELSLVDYEVDATMQFVGALQSLHRHQNNVAEETKEGAASPVHLKDNADSSGKPEMHTSIQQSPSSSTQQQQEPNQHIIHHLLNTNQISSHHIIEIIKISHFLQCSTILDPLVSIVESSIDLENCLSICCLADALGLHTLFEGSVNFVIRRLDALQGGGGGGGSGCDNDDDGAGERYEKGALNKRESLSDDSNDNDDTKEEKEEEDTIEEVWESLPYDLRSRVLTMRNILRSSIIGRGSKMSGVFFSSGNEFLAIFRENISVQKERLAESQERIDEVIRERREEFHVKRQRRGRWFDASAAAEEKFVYSGDVAYSLHQIERQAKRLTTLESFYREQKIIFSQGGNGDCKLSFDSR